MIFRVKKNIFMTMMLILLAFLLIISCESSKEVIKSNEIISKSSTPKEKRTHNTLLNKKKIATNFASKNAGVVINKNTNDSLALVIYSNYLLNYEKTKGLDYLCEYYSKYSKKSKNSTLSDSIIIILADENYRIKRLDESLEFYRKLINRNEKFKKKYNLKLFSIITEKEKAIEIYNSGLEFFNNQEFNKALSKFKASLKKQSDLKRANFRKHVTTGLMYLSKKDKKLVKVAIEKFEKAILISPEIGETYYYNAVAHLKKNSPDIARARSFFIKALDSELTEKMKITIAAKFEEFKVRFESKRKR